MWFTFNAKLNCRSYQFDFLYAKMNVRLAAQVLRSTVSNVLKDFAPNLVTL